MLIRWCKGCRVCPISTSRFLDLRSAVAWLTLRTDPVVVQYDMACGRKKIMYISSRNVKLGLPFVCGWRVLSSFLFFCWRVDHEVWCCDTLTLTMMSILAGARNVNGRRWPSSANRNHWAGGGCVATCGTLKHLLVVLRTWLLYPVGRSCCRVLITGVVELINQECAIMHASVSKDHLQRLSRRRNEGIDERN